MLLTKAADTEAMVKEVGKLAEYVNGKIPALLDFAIGVILSLVVFAIGTKVIGWIRKLIKKSLERSKLDVGVQQFLDSLVKFALYALLIFSILQNYGLDTATVAAALASCGVAVGLALQGSLSNFAGGVLILVLKPFVVGDYILEHAGGLEGTVNEIHMFYTKLKTPDNRMIIIPNGTLSNNSITNVSSQNKRRLDWKFDIAYDADLKKAKEVIENLITAQEHVLLEDGVTVFVDNLGASSVVIGARAWVPTEHYWTILWKIREDVKLALDENGIEIPFNQLTVHVEK